MSSTPFQSKDPDAPLLSGELQSLVVLTEGDRADAEGSPLVRNFCDLSRTSRGDDALKAHDLAYSCRGLLNAIRITEKLIDYVNGNWQRFGHAQIAYGMVEGQKWFLRNASDEFQQALAASPWPASTREVLDVYDRVGRTLDDCKALSSTISNHIGLSVDPQQTS